MTILLDITAVPERQCNSCLEELFKAYAISQDGDEESIWAPVPNDYIAAHVEDVTARFQAILQRIQDALSRIALGESLGELGKALAWERMSEAEAEASLARLEAKPRADYTIDDWMDVVDLILFRYLPPNVINTMAEYLVVRATLLGKIQANMDRMAAAAGNMPEEMARRWSELVPTDFETIPPRLLSPVEMSILRVAKTRAALHISNVGEATRSRIKTVLIEHVQAGILGQRAGQYKALATRLFDEFSGLNRDFRRIAVTEAGECANQGFIATQAFGSRVRRIEAYRGACDFCKGINGKIYTVVDPSSPRKNGQTEVWLGKDNVGRSAAPRQRVNGMLVERDLSKRWWCAAGVQHPHCRGAWQSVPDSDPRVKPEFDEFMDKLLAKHRATWEPK